MEHWEKSHMWDAITKVIEIVLPKLFEALKSVAHKKEHHERKQFAIFVSQLFLTLSEIANQAAYLEYSLSELIKRVGTPLVTDDALRVRTLKGDVSRLINTQVETIYRLQRLLERNRGLLVIYTGSTSADLDIFFHMKVGILSQLMSLLSSGRLPISLATIRDSLDGHYGQVKTVTFDLILNPKEKWDESLFAELKKRWDDGELQKQLSSLKGLIDNLRAELSKSFTSDELLVAMQASM
jgi:hypothetical protein